MLCCYFCFYSFTIFLVVIFLLFLLFLVLSHVFQSNVLHILIIHHPFRPYNIQTFVRRFVEMFVVEIFVRMASRSELFI